MLPKALFLSTIEKIRQQEARIDEFDKALSKMCDGFPAFDKDNLYLLALRDLLKYTMQDQYDNIGWWLYEAPDAGYTVSWEEAGKEVSVDLTEAGALYVKKSPDRELLPEPRAGIEWRNNLCYPVFLVRTCLMISLIAQCSRRPNMSCTASMRRT